MHWVLVDGRLPQDGRRGYAQFWAPDAQPEHIAPGLVTLPSGQVHEILPDHECPAGIANGGYGTRRLGYLERVLRMTYRVIRTWIRLSREQRRFSGLSLARGLFDLPGAYRIATQFRGMSYETWVSSVEARFRCDGDSARACATAPDHWPRFFIVVAGQGGDALSSTLASLDAQVYRNFEVVDDPAAALSGCGWLLMLRPGDQLAEHALFWFASEAVDRPEAAVIYADDDEIDAEGRRSRPRFKPDWSLVHLRSTNYVGRAVALRGEAVRAVTGSEACDSRHCLYDLVLRVAEQADDRVVHIPAVLLHCPPASSPGDEAELAALREHLARQRVGAGGTATVEATRPACRRVRYPLPLSPPPVSIVIPTRDALELLRQCIGSLLGTTTYPNFEILVVDNGSSDPAALDYLKGLEGRPGVRVLRWRHPFNYSAINNFAAREARGEVLCLLNNDTQVISADWLEEMVGHLVQPGVGIVGAKLYYPDGRVQHGGDTVGPGGCANHLHSFLGREDPGYCNRAAVAQELSAVTAACMITWRDLYLGLGGLNEKQLKVAFNDVDYCLRVRRAGQRVIWTPHAELYHHESVSRGRDRSLRRMIEADFEVRYMRRVWREEMKNDPFYNPNFSYFRPDFALNPAPRVKRPWI